jgi:dCTP deaminase
MYLSDRDLEFAVQTGQLIVDPPPAEYDTTSIDLHLDRIEAAQVWDVQAFEKQQRDSGQELAVVGVGSFDHEAFGKQFYKPVPEDDTQAVFRRGKSVILRPRGYFLWQTREKVGTPEVNPRLICFVDGKSTRARMGLLVHMTAPTIHAGWWGQVTLEIANLGPFTLSLKEGDAIAQIVVAALTSPPLKRKSTKGVALGQRSVGGQATATPPP